MILIGTRIKIVALLSAVGTGFFFLLKSHKKDNLTDCVESVERPQNMTRNHSPGCALFTLVNTISWFWIEPCNLIFDKRFLQSLKYYVPLPCGQNTFVS